MSDLGTKRDADAFGAALEQMETGIDAIEAAFNRLSDGIVNEKEALVDAAEFRRFADALQEQIDELRAGLEIGDALLGIYTDCEAQVAEAVESLQLPI